MLLQQTEFNRGMIDNNSNALSTEYSRAMLQRIDNMNIEGNRSLSTRNSFDKLINVDNIDKRLFSYKTLDGDDLLCVFSDKELTIYNGDSLMSTLSTPYLSEHLNELCIVQKEGDLLICHQEYPFIQVSRLSNVSTVGALPMNRYADKDELAYINSLPLDTTITDADINRLPPITRWRYENFIANNKGHIVIRITKEKEGLLLHSAFTAEISNSFFTSNITNINWSTERGSFNNGFSERLYGNLDVYHAISALQGDLFSNSVYTSSSNNKAIAERLNWVCQYLQAAYNKDTYPNVATIEVQERIYNLLPVKVFRGVTFKVLPNSPQDTMDAYHNFYVPFNFEPNTLNLQAIEAINSVSTSSSGGFNVIEPKLIHNSTEELRPSTMTFHQDRLIMGGFKDKPSTILYSRVHGYFDFTWTETNGEIPADHGIEDTITNNSYDSIRHLTSAEVLYIQTDRTIFTNKAQIISASTNYYQRVANVESHRTVKPLFINGSFMFINHKADSLLVLEYTREHDLNKVTVLTSFIKQYITTIIDFTSTTIEGVNYIYLTMKDGSIICFTYAPSESILGAVLYSNSNLSFSNGVIFNNKLTCLYSQLPVDNIECDAPLIEPYGIATLNGDNTYDCETFNPFISSVETLPISIPTQRGDYKYKFHRIKSVMLDVNNDKAKVVVNNKWAMKRWDRLLKANVLGVEQKSSISFSTLERIVIKGIIVEV